MRQTESDYWRNKWKDRKQKPANNFAKRAYKIIERKNFKNVLDLGCGDGRDSIFFVKKGLKVTAVDFSESGIRKLKFIDTKNIHCIKKDIRKINFKSNSFYIIYAHLSLHYFDDKTTIDIFRKLYKTLKSGGYIFIKCKPIDDLLFGKGEKVDDNMFRKGHTRHFFTKEYMQEKLKNFEIIRIRKTSSVYHLYKSCFIEAVAKKEPLKIFK